MKRFLVLPLCGVVLAGAGSIAPLPAAEGRPATAFVVDAKPRDLWFEGVLNQSPGVSVRHQLAPLPDGGRRETITTQVVLSRTLPGQVPVIIDIRDAKQLDTDAAGQPTAFRLDQDENGTVTRAEGEVKAGRIRGTLHRQGRSTPFDLPIPAGLFMGEWAAQELVVRSHLDAGDHLDFSTLDLLGAQVRVVRSTFTYQGPLRSGTAFRYLVRTDGIPTEVPTILGSDGRLLAATISMGPITVELAPHDGPVSLKPASISATGFIKARGPAPAGRPIHRYRVPGTLPEDAFQTFQGGVATVRSEAEPSVLTAAERRALLAAEPQLELDDADLRQWVIDLVGERTGLAAAEHLRSAVRARLIRQLGTTGAFGSALDAFRASAGDCTEHAMLLCAALRIAGIPARVDLGVVYAGDYGGWVGHAWVSAVPADRWVLLDSAYPGIPRSCYLRLATATNGNPGEIPQANLLAVLHAVGEGPIEALAP